jgi:hypothetical protein
MMIMVTVGAFAGRRRMVRVVVKAWARVAHGGEQHMTSAWPNLRRG